MIDFRMPSLGADMDEGRIVEWLVKPGDSVKKGDIVAHIETEKATLEIEIFDTGIVDAILVPVGELVPVGALLARIRVEGETPSATQPSLSAAVAPASPPPPSAATPTLQVLPAQPVEGRVPASPAARKLARERGIDLAKVQGTGPSGAITREDVERAAGEVTPPPKDPAAAMRRVIAAAMSRSKREIPHYYLATMINFRAASEWLRTENEKRPVTERLLPAALLIKAVAVALREIPEMNGFCIDGEYKPSEAIHVGIAISLRQGGLVAPAIHDTDRRSLPEMMQQLRDLVARARAGRLRGSEMSDPTITLTNLGERSVDSVFGVIYPPQVSLVGFGRIIDRPWAESGKLVVAPVVQASLSADHRVSDGHRGARFLEIIDRILQSPEKL